ncbi:SAM-dependent methyltransferase [Streptomyces cadmiisoli]|uniref:SAM-dependent methyltransferase n=1 Tax=Streptomyces cadmiisoli TaxID=2184053 RepID=UPI003D709200
MGDRLGFVLMTALSDLVRPDRYPRSSRYDPAWLLDLDMGPNPLWLLEDLAQDLDLRPGMRILDLGSGKGATSVFLAREFGARVVAADLWTAPEGAAAVFADAGVSHDVEAVRAEAHALPFEEESFDAIVSVDAFEYFGTADSYLPYLVRFLRPGGQLGMATPAI